MMVFRYKENVNAELTTYLSLSCIPDTILISACITLCIALICYTEVALLTF